MRMAILLGVATLLIAAQEPRTFADQVDDVAAASGGMTSPELQADVLIRLSKLDVPAARKKDYLVRAFHLAASASTPHPWLYRGRATDTRDWLISNDSVVGVDRLSLQTRAVQGLLPLDPLKAREFFETVTLPPSRPAGCGEELIANTVPYFDAAAATPTVAFGPEDRRKGMHLGTAGVAYARLNDIHSLDGALRSLVALEKGGGDLQAVAANALLRRAAELRVSERDADLLFRDARLQKAILDVDAKLPGVTYGRALAATVFRELAKSAHYSPPCGAAVSARPQYAELMEKLGQGHALEDWPEEPVKPVAYVAAAASPNYDFWAGGEALALLRAVQAMNQREPDPDRDWDQRLAAVQKRAAAWKRPDGMDALVYAEGQFLLLLRMVELQPEPRLAAGWMGDLMSISFGHRVLESHPGRKAIFVQRVLDFGRSRGAKPEPHPDPAPAEEKLTALRNAIAGFADPDLAVYLQLERLAPATVRSWAK